MLTVYNPPNASRIAGRGALLRSLRTLVRRVERFGIHRAATADEQAWAGTLADDLHGAFSAAVSAPDCRAALTAYDARRVRGHKTGRLTATLDPPREARR